MLNDIFVGLKRNPKKFGLTIFLCYASLWTIIEPIFSFFDPKITGNECYYYFFIFIIISIIVAILRITPQRNVEFEIKNTNTKIEILFGNLFDLDGAKIISTNDFFDTEIGKPVSDKSLLGYFITKILKKDVTAVEDAISKQLTGEETQVITRVAGKHKKFRIGTTIKVENKKSNYFLFALSESDNQCNTKVTPPLMLKSLEGLWEKIKVEGNGEIINIPLIGGGLSRIGLPKESLIQLILISIVESAKIRDFSSKIRIVLTNDLFESIELESFKNNWK